MKIYNYTADKNGLRVKVYECGECKDRQGMVIGNGKVFRLENEGKVLNKNNIFFRKPNVKEAAKRILEARKETLAELEERAKRERDMQREIAETAGIEF